MWETLLPMGWTHSAWGAFLGVVAFSADIMAEPKTWDQRSYGGFRGRRAS